MTGTRAAAIDDRAIPPTPEPSSHAAAARPATSPPRSPTRQVALIQRGTCDFAVKAANAQAAGYDAVDHLQRGPARPHGARSTARSAGPTSRIPVRRPELRRRRRSSYARHAGRPGDGARRHVDGVGEPPDHERDRGLQAGRRRRRRVVVGAHLDSVARRARASTTTAAAPRRSSRSPRSSPRLGIKPRQKLRFAFWGAEESGLLGSEHYVEHAQRRRAGQAVREPQLRHARLAELRALRLRRRRLGHADPPDPPGSAQIEDDLHAVLRLAGPGERADGVQRPLGLRPVHRGRHPRRRPVQRRRGREDGRAGGGLRRHGRAGRTTRATTRPATPSTT